MKKLTLILAAASMMAASGAMAVDLVEGKNTYTMQNCALLANDITVVTSKGVRGSIACDTTTNYMAVSLCHSKGLATTRTAVVTHNAAGTQTCTVETGSTCIETVNGSLFPSASTKNGTVTQLFPGTACDTADAAATYATQWASNVE